MSDYYSYNDDCGYGSNGRNRRYNERSNTLEEKIKPYKGQSWDSLRHQYNSHHLFEDPEFPAADESIYFTRSVPYGTEWHRPKDIMPNAQFCVDHFDRADLDQGQIGNCWFIAACAGMLQIPKCFAKVVPSDQSFDAPSYSGMFHFRFWQFGEWVDVVIDDRLPFRDGKLLFCSNKTMQNELWGPLLEKAYAKIYGGYQSLDGGLTTEALIDMTGGIGESFDLTKMDIKAKRDLWNVLLQGYNKNSVIGCSINPDPSVREARMSNGLVRGHAYTVTKVIKLQINGSDVDLVRCRNPWGNEVEWNGSWSDNSYEWQSISSADKEALGLAKAADGEFWMQFTDFLRNWQNVQICHLSADSFSSEMLEDDGDNLSWKCTFYNGSWQAGISAGGSGQSDMAKYWTNPQFHIKLTDVDKHDDKNLATVIIALMQKDARLKRRQTRDQAEDDFIQFRLFKIKDGIYVDEHKATGLKFYSNQLDRVGTSGSYINTREVTNRFRVPPGDYIVIPSTYDADHDGEFLLRVFTEVLVETTTLESNKEDLNDEESYVHTQYLDVITRKFSGVVEKRTHGHGHSRELFDTAMDVATGLFNEHFGHHDSSDEYIGNYTQRIHSFEIDNMSEMNVNNACSQM